MAIVSATPKRHHTLNSRLHTLETGMAMNIEPGIYFEGFGGMHECYIVLVTEQGAEVLTPFHDTIEDINV